MLTLPKAKATRRKFYNKWLYKVSLHINGAGMLRNHTLEELQNFYLSAEPAERKWTTAGRAWDNRTQLLAVAEFLSDYDKTIWAQRIEHYSLDLYTNDRQFYFAVLEEFETVVRSRSEPVENAIELLDDQQIILSKKLPHNKYKYRVYLKPHKLANDFESKRQYLDWIANQNGRITLTESVKHWFIRTEWNWDRRYVLVEDEQTLLMLKLRNSDVMGKVYNYVISDK
jgi:hypothetical protein